MATVFMKWLETRPEDYDRGIRLLTLGRLKELQGQIVSRMIQEGVQVLEIGCGTGALTVSMAQAGATVVGIDIAAGMLAQAERRVQALGLENRVTLTLMDAAIVAERFEPASFDLIVSSLAFSEMTPQAQAFVLESCLHLLTTGGRLVVLDEVSPDGILERLVVSSVRLPLRLVTWLLTRATTHPLRDFRSTLSRTGFVAQIVASRLSGSLQLIVATPAHDFEVGKIPAIVHGRLRHRVTLRTRIIDLWATFFRILPPYPKVVPGLYSVGEVSVDSPVLVTGNFDLTVRALLKAIDGRLDAWVLVVDSAGINVWCAAGGGFLTAEKIIGALRISRLDEIVRHRILILPQLAANGVDGWRIREQTNWGVHWGPIRAADLPAYLEAGRKKTEAMRHVRFPLRDRLEMMAATLGFYGLMILVPVAIFWRTMFWPVAVSMIGLSAFYTVVLPWLPGRDGLAKSFPLALIALIGMFIYSKLWAPVPVSGLFDRAIGLTALSVFVGAELQGMSPLMRGEQANWGWEAFIGVLLGLTYWLLPMALGWR
ncbi:MAG: methyltransferase domain-containing protein [Anaerolineales bacterium]|nr:methyltransferase domain-containing protein [Anaerolineales bacterium]